MASVVKQVIKDLIERGKTIDGLVDVKVWNNQLEQVLSGSDNVMLPSIYFERIPGDSLQFAQGVTQIDFILNIHILHNLVDAGDGTLEQNLDIFDYRDLVVKKFSMFKPSFCSSLAYVNEQEDFAHSNVYHYIVTYKAAMVDTKGSPYDPDSDDLIEKAPPTDLEFTVQIAKPYLKNTP